MNWIRKGNSVWYRKQTLARETIQTHKFEWQLDHLIFISAACCLFSSLALCSAASRARTSQSEEGGGGGGAGAGAYCAACPHRCQKPSHLISLTRGCSAVISFISKSLLLIAINIYDVQIPMMNGIVWSYDDDDDEENLFMLIKRDNCSIWRQEALEACQIGLEQQNGSN